MTRSVRTYSDLDLDFIVHPVTKDISKKFNDDAIRRSVRNLLLMVPYDKKFHPEIASSVTNLLFEPLTGLTATLVKNAIVNTLENFEPRVTISSIIVSPELDKNGFNVSLVVRIVNQIETVSINIFLEKLR